MRSRENVVPMAGAARSSGDSVMGHRIVPNTEGFVIEAWGHSPSSCFAEALSALVEEFAVVSDQPTSRLLPLSETEGVGEDALGQLLEEVVDALAVFDVIRSVFTSQRPKTEVSPATWRSFRRVTPRGPGRIRRRSLFTDFR